MKRTIDMVIGLFVLAFLLGGCSPNPKPIPAEVEEADVLDESDPAATDTAEESSAEKRSCEDPFDGATPPFQAAGWETNFCLSSVDYAEIMPGGPPRDGIPPLDNPHFETTASADNWIEDNEPVILLVVDQKARAYPLQIMTWHEIVNDEVNGVPVAVTFCPLCNTALVFIRPRIDGELLTFGTSGNLRNSDLVMWDRQTESWWQQFSGEAIVGDLTGTKLEPLPAGIISWEDFKIKYPQGQVLSIETGFNRSYGRNPYAGYDDINSHPFLFTGDLEDELPPMARVVGILLEDGHGGAFPLDLLRENQVLNEEIAEFPVAIFWKPGTASALDSSRIEDGRDVGSTAVFDPRLNGERLIFTSVGEGIFRDQQTGSTWDMFGDALEGPLAGSKLTPLPHHDTFWFAWAAFSPDDPGGP